MVQTVYVDGRAINFIDNGSEAAQQAGHLVGAIHAEAAGAVSSAYVEMANAEAAAAVQVSEAQSGAHDAELRAQAEARIVHERINQVELDASHRVGSAPQTAELERKLSEEREARITATGDALVQNTEARIAEDAVMFQRQSNAEIQGALQRQGIVADRQVEALQQMANTVASVERAQQQQSEVLHLLTNRLEQVGAAQPHRQVVSAPPSIVAQRVSDIERAGSVSSQLSRNEQELGALSPTQPITETTSGSDAKHPLMSTTTPGLCFGWKIEFGM